MKGERIQKKRWMIGFLIIQWLIFSIELAGRSNEESGPPESPSGSESGFESWELVFQEEFDEDLGRWEFQNGRNYLGGYRLKDRAVVENGFLKIQNVLGDRILYPPEILETNGRIIEPSQWESAHMWTEKEFSYGYFEARIRIAKAQSIDNAFWLMMYPIGPEIDVAEIFYWEDASDFVNQSLHGRKPGSPTAESKFSEKVYLKEDLSEDFHVYAVDWRPEIITFYVDGEITNTVTDPVLLSYFKDQPLRIRLSTAVSNIFSRDGVPSSADGTEMIVDFVRVYRMTDSGDLESDHHIKDLYN